MMEYPAEGEDENSSDAIPAIDSIESRDESSYDTAEGDDVKLGDDELDVKKNKQGKLTQRQLKIRRAIEDKLEARRLREQLDYLGDDPLDEIAQTLSAIHASDELTIVHKNKPASHKEKDAAKKQQGATKTHTKEKSVTTKATKPAVAKKVVVAIISAKS